MKNSRQYNAILNIIAIYGSKIVQLVLTFCVRTFLISYLGVEILGIDGLFSSILSVLSLADLGINTAVIYSLYLPIAQNDEKKIAALVSFFKKAYMIIGIGILVIGLSLLPFLQYIITLEDGISDLNLYYILTIIGTSATYFCSSRRVIFEADQKNRFVVIVDTVFNIIRQLGQLIVIWFMANYTVLLIFRIIMSIANNFVIYKIGDEKYPYLIKYEKEKISNIEIRSLFANTGAVFCHKLGGVIVNSTDAIIISSFIGTIVAGYYSNYMMIINGVAFLVTNVFMAITPSIGNLKVENNDLEKHYGVFEDVVLANYILSCFFTSCLLSLLNPFVSLWLGEEFTFSLTVVFLISLNFYLTTIRYGVGSFCTAAGLFKETMIKPIIESIVNLIVSIYFVNKVGVSGVIIGTIASLVCGSLWVDPYFLYKRWFKRNLVSYFFTFSTMLVSVSVVSICTFYLSSFFPSDNMVNFFEKIFVTVLVSMTGTFVSSLFLPSGNRIFHRMSKFVRHTG